MKVRIAMAIDNTGEWAAFGQGNVNQTPFNDAEAMDYIAVGGVSEGERRYWVEVDIDLPQPSVVETVTGCAEAA